MQSKPKVERAKATLRVRSESEEVLRAVFSSVEPDNVQAPEGTLVASSISSELLEVRVEVLKGGLLRR